MKKNLVILVGGAFLFLSLSPPALAQNAAKNLVEKECSKCHGLGKVTKADKDAAAWGKTLDRMIKKGADIKPEEREAVIKYLGTLKK